jgi:hypothetical protein
VTALTVKSADRSCIRAAPKNLPAAMTLSCVGMLCFFKTHPAVHCNMPALACEDSPMSKLMHALLILTFIGGAAMLAVTLRAAPAVPAPATQPKIAGANFSGDRQLQRPVNYRNWRFVSAGLGMSYGPAAQAAASTGHVMFDNVFVQPEAYDAFLRDGVWPEGTMFVLELRGALTKRTPNNGGHFQTDLHGVEVSVKDSARFKGRWAYFDFGASQSATPEPESNCFACHQQHAAVDMTFVQFYPTLQKVASAH